VPSVTLSRTASPLPDPSPTRTQPPTEISLHTETPSLTQAQVPVTWLVDWPVFPLEFPLLGRHSSPWEDLDTLIYVADDRIWRIGINEAVPRTPTPFPFPVKIFENDWESAPEDNLALVCRPEGVALFRLPDQTLIAESEIPPAFGCYADWLDDGSAVAFAGAGGDVYVWQVGKPEPDRLGNTPGALRVSWSPNQLQLLVFGTDTSFDVYFSNGWPKLTAVDEIAIGRQSDWPWLNWITDEIVSNRLYSPTGCAIEGYFYSLSGELLVGYSDCDGSKQYPLFSLDYRWLALDQSTSYLEARETNRYTIYDFQKRQETTLTETAAEHIEFLEWATDSGRLYAIVRPVAEDAANDPSLPLGLVSIEPLSLSLEPVIQDAMYALIAPQQLHVFTLSPASAGEMIAALYKIDGALIKEIGTVLMATPYDAPSAPFPVNLGWSPSGNRIVFLDGTGSLWMADVAGNLIRLAKGLSICDPSGPPCWPALIAWSPDSRFVFVQAGGLTWLLAVQPEEDGIPW